MIRSVGVSTCVCLLLLTATSRGQAPAAQPAKVSPDAVIPGELLIEPPTLINLGFEWFIQGDDNRNASVEVAFRKRGSETLAAGAAAAAAAGGAHLRRVADRSDRAQHVRRQRARSRARHGVRRTADHGRPRRGAGRTQPDRDREHATRAAAVCRRACVSCLSSRPHRPENRAGLRRIDVRVQLLVCGHRLGDLRPAAREAR